MSDGPSVYDQLGEEFFLSLVDHFYAGVADDELLRPMYPEEDLSGARARLAYFLIQYWGGPTTYSDHRGHPRLRMRHGPFRVDRAGRDAWLRHMDAALAQLDPEPSIRDTLWEYFVQAADFMRNVDDDPTDVDNTTQSV